MPHIVDKNYTTFADLRKDIKWLEHNLITKYSTINSKTSRDIVKAATKIVSTVDREIEIMLSCPSCYETTYNNPDNSMTKPCSKPHPLVWIDCGLYGYWPAKLLKYCKDGKLFVRYFGDYTTAHVLSSKCMLYSREIPENNFGISEGDSFTFAQQVSFDYYCLFEQTRLPILVKSFSL